MGNDYSQGPDYTQSYVNQPNYNYGMYAQPMRQQAVNTMNYVQTPQQNYNDIVAARTQAAVPVQSAPSSYCLKGRPVCSYEEATAAQIDLDGSLHVFTDLNNNRIYTKQLGADGKMQFNTYVYSSEPVVTQSIQAANADYITRDELSKILKDYQQHLMQSLNIKREEPIVERPVEKVEQNIKDSLPNF